MINQYGDSVITYVVEMGRMNDSTARITREIEAKCDYIAVEIAERMTTDYKAFHVYKSL